MVTFNCEVCNATVPKKNTEKHYNRCPNAYYTCIDCSKTFDDGVSYKKHTQCISEDEKYQKALYKGKKKQQQKQTPVLKKEEKKKKKKEEDTAKFQLTKGKSLYKIMKDMKDKKSKKELLKKLVVDANGNLVLQE